MNKVPTREAADEKWGGVSRERGAWDDGYAAGLAVSHAEINKLRERNVTLEAALEVSEPNRLYRVMHTRIANQRKEIAKLLRLQRLDRIRSMKQYIQDDLTKVIATATALLERLAENDKETSIRREKPGG